MAEKKNILEEALALVKNNVFLSAKAKNDWISRLNKMSNTEIYTFLKILKDSQKKFASLIENELKKTQSKNLLKKWASFKKEQSSHSADAYHDKEAKQAEQTMLDQIDNI